MQTETHTHTHTHTYIYIYKTHFFLKAEEKGQVLKPPLMSKARTHQADGRASLFGVFHSSALVELTLAAVSTIQMLHDLFQSF